ncbi:MAG: ACT domain-containing protein [Clostridia bacterium]|nr:ACT domain-containing protein [Clostridia bacterium]
MILQILPQRLTVCKVAKLSDIDLMQEFFFLSKTDEEISLVCETRYAPSNATHREDGWKAFRIQGTLDFSLIGILSKITTILAENQIGIFAVSTYNTDYILVKEENFKKAMRALGEAGHEIRQENVSTES